MADLRLTGEWTYVQDENGYLHHVFEGEKRLLRLNSHSVPGAQAKARLIAAAPELLEALKQLAYFVEASGDHATPTGEFVEFTSARKAIAKAKGEDS